MSDYTVERREAVVSVKEYINACVDVEKFLGYCRECPNYGKVWSCPEYDFDVLEYWQNYQTMKIIGLKVILSEELRKILAGDDKAVRWKVIEDTLWVEKKKLSGELYQMEKDIPGSMSLSAGSCMLCKKGCARREGKECRNPSKVRYSIESIGGDVGKTAADYLDIKMEWMEEGKIPHYFTLVCGLLMKE